MQLCTMSVQPKHLGWQRNAMKIQEMLLPVRLSHISLEQLLNAIFWNMSHRIYQDHENLHFSGQSSLGFLFLLPLIRLDKEAEPFQHL